MLSPDNGRDDVQGFDDLLFADGFIPFILVMLGGIIYLIYSKYKYNKAQKSWQSGVFNNKQAFGEDALLEAYIRLGGIMLRKDQEDLKGKMTYLRRYFEQHFEQANENSDILFALKSSFQNPVDLNTVIPWLKTHLSSLSQRSQLIYFLAGLSSVDGSINAREKQFLTKLAHLLDISKKDFDSIMAMYSKYEEAHRDRFRQRSAPHKPKSQYKREKAAEILGVSLNASSDEIKKAYRSLAKVHHPDRFANESESQQKIAEERFVKIQLAYELLMEFD